MRVRTRYPRLVAVVCKVYRLTLWIYPFEFRRAFGHDLVLTFRNRVEDVVVSLLGLREADAAYGCMGRAADVQFIFFVAGLALTFVSWYTFFIALPASLS